jgi:hypothetical protein
MTSLGSSVLPKTEIIIVVDDDDEVFVPPKDAIPVVNPKNQCEKNSKPPKQRRIRNIKVQARDSVVEEDFQYVDLCKENLDMEVESKAIGNSPIKKRGNDFPQGEPRNMHARHRGLAERGEVNADGRAAAAPAVAVPDAPPQPLTLVRLSPNLRASVQHIFKHPASYVPCIPSPKSPLPSSHADW